MLGDEMKKITVGGYVPTWHALEQATKGKYY